MTTRYNLREIAIKIIYETLYKNQSRDILLNYYFNKIDFSEKDKNLIFNLVLNTIRFKEVFDEIINSHLIPLYKLEKFALTASETVLAQILTMDRIPTYAAINETIDAYKRLTMNRKGANFLNYLLRKIDTIKDIKKDFERFKRCNSLFNKFITELKTEIQTGEIAKIYFSSFERPPLFIRVRGNVDATKNILINNHIDFAESKIVPNSIIIEDVKNIKLIRNILPSDSYTIQSELSQIAIYLLNVKQNNSVLDVCSGNQIKATQIYDICNGNVDITSVDIKDIPNPKYNFIKADAKKVSFNKCFDRILIDPPCSGLGTLSQNPEIKFKINLPAIKRFASIQYEIIKNISQYLTKDGYLLYCVCTITASETSNLIKKFVEENPQFEIIRPSMSNTNINQFIDKNGFIKIVNYNNNSFFYSLIKRK